MAFQLILVSIVEDNIDKEVNTVCISDYINKFCIVLYLCIYCWQQTRLDQELKSKGQGHKIYIFKNGEKQEF